jgi:heme/copper-type cytochrome/quinol oxidase subunit 2
MINAALFMLREANAQHNHCSHKRITVMVAIIVFAVLMLLFLVDWKYVDDEHHLG